MAQYDININQGADFQILLTLEAPDQSRIDLTDFTFSGQIRKNVNDPSPAASFTFEIRPQGVPETRGQVFVRLSAAASAALPVDPQRPGERADQKFLYDIEATDGSGIRKRWLGGNLFMSPEVTR